MQIQKDYVISLFLDTRHQKKQSKLYPVKLRVFCSQTRKAKLYSTKFEFESEKLFDSIWKTEKPRKVYEELRLEMQAAINLANEAARSLSVFTFESFENAMQFTTGTGRLNVYNYYQQAIADYKQAGRIGTASNYQLSERSLKLFSRKESINFAEINPNWLKAYEKYMLSEGKAVTTIGVYLRPLRAIFNLAIEQRAINPDLYPFGRRKYVIPAPKGTKRALSREQLKTLWEATPQTPEQQLAKDFFFFSYQLNGMNVKDILMLKYKNISGDQLSFYRSKTENTDRNQTPVTVFLTENAKQTIERYGSSPKLPERFIFPFVDPKARPEDKHKQVQNFTRKINQHIRKLAAVNGIEAEISTYFARHSFATNAIRAGFSMEAVSEALAHSNLATTKAYFAGFDREEKQRMAESLMNF